MRDENEIEELISRCEDELEGGPLNAGTRSVIIPCPAKCDLTGGCASCRPRQSALRHPDRPLDQCCNGCDAPPRLPSYVLCEACLAELDAKVARVAETLAGLKGDKQQQRE